jgi:hypothetical protein
MVISDQEKRDQYVDAAVTGAQYSWGSWKSDGYNHEGGNYFNYQVEHLIFMR